MATTSSPAPVTQRKTVRDLLDKMKGQFAAALPQHLTVDKFIRVALTTVNRTPKLAEATQESLLEKLMDCAQLGLLPDGVSGQAYLIPFEDNKRKCVTVQLIVGYQGLCELAYRHPKVKAIRWNTVFAKDKFEWEEGLTPKLKHIPSSDDDRGELTHAYAICDLEGEAKTWVVLTKSDVLSAKKRSRSASSDYSPWNTDTQAMWAKTAVRRLAKQLPKSNELAEALARDDDREYDLDIEGTPIRGSKLLEQATVEPANMDKAAEPEKVPVESKSDLLE